MKPKYAIDEIERRWLVAAEDAEPYLQDAALRIVDKYIDGCRLRLRMIEDTDGECVYKFCKKYGRHYSNQQEPAEPITNLYLDSSEYTTLKLLPGTVVNKERFKLTSGAIDRYRLSDETVYIFEIEFPDTSAARNYSPPEFVGEEVTGREDYSGFTLAQRSRA